MRRSRSAPFRRSAAFRSRAGVPASIALAVALAATGTGCAAQTPADPSSDVLTIALEDWQALDEAGQREALEADGRELGAFLIQASGLAETTGTSAEAIEAQIPRLPAFVLPEPTEPTEPTTQAPAQPTSPDDLGDIDLGDIDLGDIDMDELEGMVQGGVDAELSAAQSRETEGLVVQPASFADGAQQPRAAVDAKGAAIAAITDMVDGLHEVLLDARLGQKVQSLEDSDASSGYTYSTEFDMGKLTSRSSSSRTTVIENVSTTIDSGSAVDVDVCPDVDGEVSGFFAVDGGITVPGPDGEPVKTQLTVMVELTATVDDDAFAVDSVGQFEGVVRTGAPGDGPTGMTAVTSTKKYAGTMTINYANDMGTDQAVRARTAKVTGDEGLADLTNRTVQKLQQKALEEAELYWRNGGCVRADVEEPPAAVERGGSTGLEVVSRPLDSPTVIETAVADPYDPSFPVSEAQVEECTG